MAVSYDGVDDVYQLANESTLRYEWTQPFSGHAWIKKSDVSGFPIMGKAQNSPPAAQQRGWAFNTEIISGQIGLSLHLTNNGGTTHAFMNAQQPTGGVTSGMQTGLWVPVGFTYDGSGLTSGMKLYANGVELIANFTEDTLGGATILVNGTPVRIGGFDTEFWLGSSCGITIVPARLNQNDMRLLADIRNRNRNPSTFLSSAPDVWVPFTTTNSTIDLSDYSGNGHNASVSTGSPTTIPDPRVVFDTFNAGTITTTGSVSITPTGNVEAVVVLVQQTGSALDRISGISYGNLAMTRPANGFAQDTAGEVGASYAYVLLGNVGGMPQGTQSATVTVSAGSESKRVTIITINAVQGGVTISATGKVEGDTANPSVTLATPATFAGFVLNGLFSGQDDRNNVTEQSGCVKLGPGNNFGTDCAVQECGNFTGANVASGWTATSDDAAMVALALEALGAKIAWIKA